MGNSDVRREISLKIGSSLPCHVTIILMSIPCRVSVSHHIVVKPQYDLSCCSNPHSPLVFILLLHDGRHSTLLAAGSLSIVARDGLPLISRYLKFKSIYGLYSSKLSQHPILNNPSSLVSTLTSHLRS